MLTAPVANGEGGGDAGAEGSGFLMIIMLGILVLFIVMTFRRSRKLRQQQQQATSTAVVGAEVITAGGIIGKVVARDEERQRITLEFSNGDRMDFLLGAVQQVTERAPGDKPSSDDTETNNN
ncbi:preprotein translocase subunit YajC [Nesterenkonia sp. MY13]|uniref:Preprotein translocase subunit YajC n=1 Tax=Nesterenkonia sedimenti TaxID=1463632 RepID=A0A7X8THL7_9MICC|nr:preprotein translocase subunit YajC [Nesterenkonia sedimenti]NLS08734.1 preprotein translocase subunit YajC [Nesterenkonia sedimenti]